MVWFWNGRVIAMVPTIPIPNHWKSEQNGRHFVPISNGFGQNGCCSVQNGTPMENRMPLNSIPAPTIFFKWHELLDKVDTIQLMDNLVG